jgi:hypothetical protein
MKKLAKKRDQLEELVWNTLQLVLSDVVVKLKLVLEKAHDEIHSLNVMRNRVTDMRLRVDVSFDTNERCVLISGVYNKEHDTTSIYYEGETDVAMSHGVTEVYISAKKHVRFYSEVIPNNMLYEKIKDAVEREVAVHKETTTNWLETEVEQYTEVLDKLKTKAITCRLTQAK